MWEEAGTEGRKGRVTGGRQGREGMGQGLLAAVGSLDCILGTEGSHGRILSTEEPGQDPLCRACLMHTQN